MELTCLIVANTPLVRKVGVTSNTGSVTAPPNIYTTLQEIRSNVISHLNKQGEKLIHNQIIEKVGAHVPV